MTRHEVEKMLTEWRMVPHDLDNRVRWAVVAGVGKYRINRLTGIGRSTIDRLLAASGPAGTSTGPAGGVNDH